MAKTTQTQREQIIMTARKNPHLKHGDIADMLGLPKTITSNIICRSKRNLGESFYLNGGKRPTANTSLVYACLVRSPNVAIKSSTIESNTGLTKQQVRHAVNHLKNQLEHNITRHVNGETVCYFYNPQAKEVKQKPLFNDVFSLMNKTLAL